MSGNFKMHHRTNGKMIWNSGHRRTGSRKRWYLILCDICHTCHYMTYSAVTVCHVLYDDVVGVDDWHFPALRTYGFLPSSSTKRSKLLLRFGESSLVVVCTRPFAEICGTSVWSLEVCVYVSHPSSSKVMASRDQKLVNPNNVLRIVFE